MRAAAILLALLAATASADMQSSGRRIINVGVPAGLPFSSAVQAGNFIYVAGTLSTNDAGQVEGADVREQTRRVLDRIGSVLASAGSSLDNAVAVMVYLKRAEDFAAMNEVYRTYWTKDPPTRTTVVAGFIRPEALIEISMIAVPAGGERVVIHPSSWIRSPNPYSYGIKSGDTLFLAGLVSRNGRDNSIVTGDTVTQVRTIMDNAGEILKAANMSHADVVSSRVYVTELAQFQDMNAAYRTYFPKNPPTRATVVAALMGPQYTVEITMLAVAGPKDVVTVEGSQPNPNLSAAIRAGNRLFVSGMLGNTEATKGDARAQTRETLTRIGRALKAGGFDWPQVVDAVVYMPDLKHYAAMNEAYKEVLPRDFPARATVQVDLVRPDALVEIMATAVR